jgi:hypothetical protein
MTEGIAKNIVINVLLDAISFLITEDEGIVVDTPEGRFIVGKMKGEMVINQCQMEAVDEEFKNVKSGTKIKLTGVIEVVHSKYPH